ncbi:MAG TPA: hypothetical protein VI485_19330 [Vicinamibacterales bacterium]|nr:hypothetical protein [Vicinamibacterales bacterium]
MSPYVDRIVASIRDAEDALSEDVRAQQQRWQYGVRRGRVWFDKEARRVHKHLKQSVPAFLGQASLLNLLTTPIIYSLSLPLLLLDLWISLYQWICFPIYGIARVSRTRYFMIDRHKLGYLNAIEKANCMYCSYANGLFAYVREVGARTEHFWCPIKHSRPIAAPHPHYQLFFDYGDAAGYHRGLPGIREALARERSVPARAKRAKR